VDASTAGRAGCGSALTVRTPTSGFPWIAPGGRKTGFRLRSARGHVPSIAPPLLPACLLIPIVGRLASGCFVQYPDPHLTCCCSCLESAADNAPSRTDRHHELYRLGWLKAERPQPAIRLRWWIFLSEARYQHSRALFRFRLRSQISRHGRRPCPVCVSLPASPPPWTAVETPDVVPFGSGAVPQPGTQL
jgi:hypothetical protein